MLLFLEATAGKPLASLPEWTTIEQNRPPLKRFSGAIWLFWFHQNLLWQLVAHVVGMEYGIDPVYALAFFLHEDSFGETGIGAANHSLGNIRCSAGYVCQFDFRYYATWQDGYADWYSLILNGYVRGEITDAIVGHPCVTVEEIVPVYAPSSDHNDVVAYIAAIEQAVQRWRSGQVWV